MRRISQPLRLLSAAALLLAVCLLSACTGGTSEATGTAAGQVTEEPTDTATASTETDRKTEPDTATGSGTESTADTATEPDPATETETDAPAPTMPEEVLSGLRGIARFAGAYTYDVQENDEYDARLYIDTIFADRYIWQREYDPASGEVFYDNAYGRDGRRLTVIQHNADNTMSELVSDDLFENYYNPFDRLSAADFVQVAEDVYSLTDKEKAASAARALSGWNESVDSFCVYVEDGRAVRVTVRTALIHPSDTLSYISTYEYTVSEQGTAAVDPERIAPYRRTAAHDILETALRAAQASGSYIIRHQGHEVGYVEPDGGETRPGYGDTDYLVYVTPDLLYDSYAGEEHGFKLLNGYVYPFDVDQAGRVVLHDPVNVADISALAPCLTGFTVELFRDDGDGVFTLRDSSAAGTVARLFAVGNEQASYAYATNFSIRLRDGKLWQAVFTYKTYGIEETVTLTYDFDTPIRLSLDFDSATKQSVLDAFVGQYRDDAGHFCHVDGSGFLLNGIEVSVQSYDSENGIFIGSWDGNTVYIQKLSSLQLMVYTEDMRIAWTLTSIADVDVTVPAAYRGTWEYHDSEYDDVFRIQSHVIFYNGEALTLISFTESEGATAEALTEGSANKGKTFNFHLSGDGILLVTIVSEDLTMEPFTVKKTSDDPGVEIPAEFVGIYLSADGSRKVVITYAGITVDGKPFLPDSYTADGGFIGTWDGQSGYAVQFYGVAGTVNKDRLLIGLPGSNATLERTASLSEKYIGTWQSTGREYTVVITDTSVTVNGKTVPFRLDAEYGYALELESSAYTTFLLYYVNEYGNALIALYDDAGTLFNLLPVEPVAVPGAFLGVWKGADGSHGWTVTVGSDGTVTLLRDDGTRLTPSIASQRENQLILESGTSKWSLSLREDGTLNLFCVDEADVTLHRAISIAVPEKYCGSWASTDGRFRLVISADSFAFTVDGRTVSVTELWEDDALYFRADGQVYLLDAGYGTDALMLFSEDYSLHELVHRQGNGA